MLNPDQQREVSAAFGVSTAQVRRDHLISHILAALAALEVPVLFFGGTALARTYIAGANSGSRLSEDIDLACSARHEVAELLDSQLPLRLRREFPRTRWDPPLSSTSAVEPGQLVTPDGLRVRIQLLGYDSHRELAQWPTEIRCVTTRYDDVITPVMLKVPTLVSAAAMKTAAWMDRHAPRDLYDLDGLARLGSLTEETADLVQQVTGWHVQPYFFATLPTMDWDAQLSHQVRDLPSPQDCLDRVRRAYGTALHWPSPGNTFD